MSRPVTPLPEMRAAAPDLVGALEPVYIAETEAEREAVFSFRYSVYGAELGRKLGNADHGRQRIHDEEDDKPYTTLLFTDDGAGQLTGTARIRQWEPGEIPAKDWETFSMERFEGLREMPTAEVGRLMIEPGHRGQLGLVSMSCAVYQLCGGNCRPMPRSSTAQPAWSAITGCWAFVPTRDDSCPLPTASRCRWC